MCETLSRFPRLLRVFLVAQKVRNPPAMQETQIRSLGREDPLEEGMAAHSSTLAWRIHGQRSLAGYSPWGGKESDSSSQLHFHFQGYCNSGFLSQISAFSLSLENHTLYNTVSTLCWGHQLLNLIHMTLSPLTIILCQYSNNFRNNYWLIYKQPVLDTFMELKKFHRTWFPISRDGWFGFERKGLCVKPAEKRGQAKNNRSHSTNWAQS